MFLTVPYMSPLRKVKAKLGIYPKLENKINNNFYCFILDEKDVIKNVEKYGFKLIHKIPYGATKGLKDEIFILKPLLQIIYDSQSIFLKAVKFLISLLFSRITGHCVLLVFRNNKS